MRIVFMGTPDYAAVILDALLECDCFEVVGAVIQPDKEVGRGKKMTPPATKALLVEKEFKGMILQPNSLKGDDIYYQLIALKPDVIIVAAFGHILPKRILEIAPCYNLHASLLPRHRGASPIQEALLMGDEYVGVSFMAMEEGLDSGAYLAKTVLRVKDHFDSTILFELLAKEAAKLTVSCLCRLSELEKVQQRASDATYCHKIQKNDGLVTFDDANLIVRKLKAYALWPGIFLESGLKIKRAMIECCEGAYQPGVILEICKDCVIVGCSIGKLRIFSVQPPSKKEMSTQAYVNGKRLKCGDYLF